MEDPGLWTNRSIVEQADGTVLVFGSDSSWYAGFEPPPRSLLGVAPQWYREGRGAPLPCEDPGGSVPQTVENAGLSPKRS